MGREDYRVTTPPTLLLIKMKNEKEQVWVAVMGCGGIVETVRVFRADGKAEKPEEDIGHAKAMDAIGEHLEDTGYTAEQWFEAVEKTNEFPDEDGDPTNLYLTELE